MTQASLDNENDQNDCQERNNCSVADGSVWLRETESAVFGCVSLHLSGVDSVAREQEVRFR